MMGVDIVSVINNRNPPKIQRQLHIGKHEPDIFLIGFMNQSKVGEATTGLFRTLVFQ